MLRGSVCGGPSVFLNNILYGKDGLLAGLYLRGPEQDVHLLHNLVMVSAAAARSRYTQPLDAMDLGKKIAEIDDMLLSIFDSRSFSVDHNISLALLLQSFPESIRKDGQYNYRYFAAAFATGPLAIYLENDLSRMLTCYQMGRVIDNVFTCSLKGDPNGEKTGLDLNGRGSGSRHYGERTAASREVHPRGDVLYGGSLQAGPPRPRGAEYRGEQGQQHLPRGPECHADAAGAGSVDAWESVCGAGAHGGEGVERHAVHSRGSGGADEA